MDIDIIDQEDIDQYHYLLHEYNTLKPRLVRMLKRHPGLVEVPEWTNVPGEIRHTVLMIAAINNDYKMAKWLVESLNANVFAVTSYGQTALTCAQRNSPEIYSYLKNHIKKILIKRRREIYRSLMSIPVHTLTKDIGSYLDTFD